MTIQDAELLPVGARIKETSEPFRRGQIVGVWMHYCVIKWDFEKFDHPILHRDFGDIERDTKFTEMETR